MFTDILNIIITNFIKVISFIFKAINLLYDYDKKYLL